MATMATEEWTEEMARLEERCRYYDSVYVEYEGFFWEMQSFRLGQFKNAEACLNRGQEMEYMTCLEKIDKKAEEIGVEISEMVCTVPRSHVLMTSF